VIFVVAFTLPLILATALITYVLVLRFNRPPIYRIRIHDGGVYTIPENGTYRIEFRGPETYLIKDDSN
jgi:hypothetical protein